MNPKQFEAKLKSIIKKYDVELNKVVKIAKTPAFLDPIADIAANLIRVRTRLGYGVRSEGQERSKLKPLSSKYIDFRKKYKNLSGFTTAKRSNLTLTGQLLDSLKGRSNTRGIIVYLDKRRNGESLTNPQLKDYQEEKGRYFFYLSRTEIINVNREYRQRFYELLKSSSILVR